MKKEKKYFLMIRWIKESRVKCSVKTSSLKLSFFATLTKRENDEKKYCVSKDFSLLNLTNEMNSKLLHVLNIYFVS